LTVLLAGCASAPREGGAYDAQSRREIGAFSQKKYGPASPRMVADGQDVPRGGGRYHVGKPYRVAGRTYVPTDSPRSGLVGNASWYGAAFHGRKTANGEIFDRHSLSAAHPTMPLPSYARVTNIGNGRSIVVRVNDRGPFHAGRIIDVSQRVADALDFRHIGTARVKVDYVGPAGLGGSDDRRLIASLRTDGQPASLGGPSLFPTLVAAVERPFASTPAPAAAPAPAPATRVVVPAPAPAEQRPTVQTAEARPAPAGRIVYGLPLPPDRPFDLVTIPHAGTPVAVVATPVNRATTAAPLPPERPQRLATALFFDAPDVRPTRFARVEAAFAAFPIDRFAAPAGAIVVSLRAGSD
jgi:rare lipoprotein A